MIKESNFSHKKIKIVVTDTAILYPPKWGGPKRIWNLFSNFSKELFDIDYVGLDLSSIGSSYKVKKIAPNFREFLIGLPKFSKIWNFFESVFLNDLELPLFSYLMPHTVKEFNYIFKNLKKDIIICSHPWSGMCVEKNDSELFIYDAHNCEYNLMKQLVGESFLGKIISRRVRNIEEQVCEKSDIILVCSEEDKKIFKKFYGINDNKFKVVSNGTIIGDSFSGQNKKYAKRLLQLNQKPMVLFIGSYYKPNVEAATFIVEELADKLKDLNFVIGGSVKNHFNKRKLSSNVKLFPEVGYRCDEEEVKLLLKASDVAVNPIISGSGTSIKLLDYLSSGIPTVTTLIGKRGYSFENKEEVYVVALDNFPKAIREILENRKLYNKLSKLGRKAVANNYNWKKISRRLEKTMLENCNYGT